MGFGEAVRSCLNKYAVFSGRAPRSEYWYFTLFYFLVGMAIIAVGMTVIVASRNRVAGAMMGIAMVLFFLGILLPHLAVTIRRLHDINMSGWWFLIAFVPFGSLVLLAFTFMPGSRGDNRFGPDPFAPQRVADVFD